MLKLSRVLYIPIILGLICASLLVMVVAPAAFAQGGVTCTTLQPNATTGKDAYIKQEKPDERRGGDSELSIKTETGKLERSLLQFDLSSLPAGATVNSATLSLYVKAASGGAVTINARGLTADWTESEVTWKARNKAANQLWTTQGGDFGATVSSTSVDDTKDVWRSWNVATLVTGWLSNPASNFGVILESPVTNPKTDKVFKSSDDGTSAQRPKLEVCYSTGGVTITPDNSGGGVAGVLKRYPHVITLSNVTSVVNLTASSNRGWVTKIYQDLNGNGAVDGGDTEITATPSFGPNGTFAIIVEVNVPIGAANGVVDVTTVTATAVSGGSSDTATDQTTVGALVSVQPNNALNAVPGATIFYGHQIVNNTASQQCFNVSASSNNGWSVLLWEDLNGNGVHETSNPNEPALSNPVCVAASGTYRLVAELTVPGNAAIGAIDTTVVQATNTQPNGPGDNAVDTTTIFAGGPPVIDGKYDDVYSQSPDSTEVCYNSNGVLFGKLATFYQSSSDSVYMVLAIDKDFVDNTYGVNAITWPSGHTFGNLTGSDHAQFYGFDANGTKVLDFKLDYITSKTGVPSGYDTLGVTGGEGRMNIGSAASITEWGTSISYSLNDTGYCAGGNCSGAGTNLLVNSPATNAFYTPNPTYPNWIFDVIYEVKIAKTAFGGSGFGRIEVPYIHASPSKLGTNTIYAEPGVCPGEIGDRVWNDTNGDGVQDNGEPGINNVTLNLYRDNGDGILNTASDTLVGSKITSNGGLYLFQDLAPNDYFVDVVNATVPAGLSLTTNNDPTAVIELDAGESYLLADFGYASGGRIGDFVWYDLDNDGIQDAGEPGIPNITVRLYDGSNNLLAETVTNASGYYFFAGRAAGNYQVGFVLPSGYKFSPQDTPNDDAKDSDADTTTGRSPIFALAQNATNLTIDAGMSEIVEPPDARLGDRVWLDVNGNGIQNAGEPGVANVPVTLYNITGTQVANTVTSISGSYGFTVTPGSYVVEFGKPFGYEFVTPHVGSDEAVDSDADTTTGRTPTIVLFPGANDTSIDAGVYQPATLGNFVWRDLNNNGIQDGGGETGILGVNVELYNSANVQIDSATTNGSGFYAFVGLAPGSYTIKFILPAGSAFSPADQGGNNATDSDANPATGRTIPITLVSGQTDLTWDAGMYPPAEIGDRVFLDSNRNKVQDNGEPGIGGVIVELYTGVLCDQLVSSQTTENDGSYLFDGLTPGHYCVLVPENPIDNPALSGLTRTTDTNPFDRTLAPNESYLDADFGYVGTGVIGDFVWYDGDGDGVQDNGENGISNVVIVLYKDDGDGILEPNVGGDPTVGSRVTGANGDYLFTGLLQGVYFATVSDPFLTLNGLTATSGPDVHVQSAPITLPSGGSFLDADFGYWKEPPPGQAIIGDRVWYDGNGDGVQDAGEPGIPGIQVCATPQGGGAPLCATTNLVGNYLIVTPVGSYVVAPTNPPAGLPATTPTSVNVTVAAGDQYLDADFGYNGAALGSIGDAIWDDLDHDGIYEPATEPGFSGVTVNLFRDANNSGDIDGTDPVIATSSGVGGAYLFDGLVAGTYFVQVSDTANVLDNYEPTIPGAVGVNNNNQVQPYKVVLAAGENNLTADFGYWQDDGGGQGGPTGEIGDQLWHETDGDGIYEPLNGETGIAGVTVEICPLIGAPIGCQEVATNIAGFYLLQTLDLTTTYTVQVTDDFGVLAAAGYVPTTIVGGTANNTNKAQPYQVTLSAAVQSDRTADFGYISAPANYTIVKQLASSDGVRPGQPFVFTIQVVNTGALTITQLPLRDIYTPSYLRYVNANPASDNNNDDGQIDWSDLTVSFNRDLGPGQSFAVVVNFMALADTTALQPDGRTPNQASVIGARAGQIVLTDKSSSVRVRIEAPTAALLSNLAADLLPEGVTLSWTTLNEEIISGFNVLRLDGEKWQRINGALIPAQYSGTSQGASYSTLDAGANGGQAYMVEIVMVNGQSENVPIPQAGTQHRQFLPVITR